MDQPIELTKAARRAARTAAGWMASPFVVFDTETTGFGTDDEIIQISIVDQDGQVLLDSFIKPEGAILNSEYHNITDGVVAAAPTFPEIYPRIVEALEGKRVMAYNLDYDQRMLNQVIERHKLEPLDWVEWNGQLCAMKLYAPFHGEWNDHHHNYRWQKLDTAARRLNVQRHGDAHNALSDTMLTLEVVKALARIETD